MSHRIMETIKIEVERPKWLPRSTDPDAAYLLIRDIGFLFLGGYDGCECTGFDICGIAVQVSCRKSQNTVSITTGETTGSPQLLKAAHLILDQIFQVGYEPDASDYYREWAEDGRREFKIFVNGVMFPGVRAVSGVEAAK